MIAFGLWSATDLNKSGDGAGWYPMRAQVFVILNLLNEWI